LYQEKEFEKADFHEQAKGNNIAQKRKTN